MFISLFLFVLNKDNRKCNCDLFENSIKPSRVNFKYSTYTQVLLCNLLSLLHIMSWSTQESAFFFLNQAHLHCFRCVPAPPTHTNDELVIKYLQKADNYLFI